MRIAARLQRAIDLLRRADAEVRRRSLADNWYAHTEGPFTLLIEPRFRGWRARVLRGSTVLASERYPTAEAARAAGLELLRHFVRHDRELNAEGD